MRGLFGLSLIWMIVGCVPQSEYLRMQRALGTEIISLRQGRDAGFKKTILLEKQRKQALRQMRELQKKYAALNTKYKQALSNHERAMAGIRKQLALRDANLKKCGAMVQGRGKKLFELQAELAKKQQELQVKEQEFLKKQQGLNAKLKQQQDELKKKQAALANTLRKVRLMQKQIDGLRKVFTDLKDKLKSLVQAGKLRIRMIKGRLVLQLPEKILFASGRYSLKRAGRKAIAKVTFHLKEMKYRWQVVGHTDSVGRPSYNWRLSANRALSVLLLMVKSGMPPTQISLTGYGQYQPAVPNDSREHKALNRRTELVLIPDLSSIFASVK